MQTFDVVVVGAGIVGAALAVALRDADLAVALIEPAPPRQAGGTDAGWDSRIYTFSPGNVAGLESPGVWSRMPPERMTRVESMAVFGDRPQGHIEFSAYEAGLRELAWVAESRELQRALWSVLEMSPHVTLHAGARCEDIEWQRSQALI